MSLLLQVVANPDRHRQYFEMSCLDESVESLWSRASLAPHSEHACLCAGAHKKEDTSPCSVKHYSAMDLKAISIDAVLGQSPCGPCNGLVTRSAASLQGPSERVLPRGGPFPTLLLECRSPAQGCPERCSYATPGKGPGERKQASDNEWSITCVAALKIGLSARHTLHSLLLQVCDPRFSFRPSDVTVRAVSCHEAAPLALFCSVYAGGYM